MVILLTLGAGAVVGGVVALLAIRWPSTPDPHVSGGTITKEVVRHPGLAGHLRHHFNPKTETGVALIIATAVVGGAAVGIGVLLAMIRTKFGLQSVDVRLARFGAEHATAWSTDFLRHLSELGGTRGVILMALVACAIESRRGQAARRGHVPDAGRRRPVRAVQRNQVPRRAGPSGFQPTDRLRRHVVPVRSFDSGRRDTRRDRAARDSTSIDATRKTFGAALAAGTAAMVGATRVFLGVHWFSDVVAGLLLGWAWFAMCSIAFGGRLLIFGLPVAEAEAVADAVPSAAPVGNAGSGIPDG